MTDSGYPAYPPPQNPNDGQPRPAQYLNHSTHYSGPPLGPTRRRRSPLVIATIILALILMLIIGGGYVVRNAEAHDIEAVLVKWDKTGELNGNYERNQLTCAKWQDPSAQTPSTAKPNIRETIDVYNGVTQISISPLLDTAYARARLTSTDLTHYDSQGNYPSESINVGFELVKENGSWKVCDEGINVMGRGRALLLGWKLSGPPQR